MSALNVQQQILQSKLEPMQLESNYYAMKSVEMEKIMELMNVKTEIQQMGTGVQQLLALQNKDGTVKEELPLRLIPVSKSIQRINTMMNSSGMLKKLQLT